jgi:hypothetical protein
MSVLKFDVLSLSFFLFLVMWGFWGYWRKGGPHRYLFLMIAVLAALGLSSQSLASSGIGYAIVIALHWLLAIVVLAALLSIIKDERGSN